MTPDVAQVIREGLTLDADQRAQVVQALLDSLQEDAQDRNTVEEWRSEILLRLGEIRTNAVEAVNADEHYARLRASLSA